LRPEEALKTVGRDRSRARARAFLRRVTFRDGPHEDRSWVLDLIDASLLELARISVSDGIEVDLLAVEHHLRGARSVMRAALSPVDGVEPIGG
jgi:hypothetical protein